MEFINAFLAGGCLCVLGQILLDKTNLTPAKILLLYVVSGVVLTALGLYEPFVNWGGAGATTPLTGFGYALAKGVEKAISETGILGVFSGGLTATSAGIAAAMLFGLLAALLSRPKMK